MKKKIAVLLVAIIILLSTGCTKQLVNADKQRIINETTGQSLTSNILCLPEGEDLLKLYKENEEFMEVKLEELPACSNMKIYESGNYNGLWVQLFVRPIAWCIIKLGLFLGNYGLSVMIMGLIIRLILMPFSAKTIRQSENMKKAQPYIEKIEKKYKDKQDQESMMAMSRETLEVYKKYKVNPMSSCLVTFVQLPLFFAFLEAINRVPAIFENYFWKFQLGTTPLVGIKAGNYYYIILIILILLFTAWSFKFSMSSMAGNSEQVQQTKFMMIFMTVFIGIASIQLPAAIALYWVVTNAFNVVQTYIFKRGGSKHDED